VRRTPCISSKKKIGERERGIHGTAGGKTGVISRKVHNKVGGREREGYARKEGSGGEPNGSGSRRIITLDISGDSPSGDNEGAQKEGGSRNAVVTAQTQRF